LSLSSQCSVCLLVVLSFHVDIVPDFFSFVFFFQAEDGIRDATVTGVQTCALPISSELYSSAGRPNAPIVSGGKCPWNPALCTDITTASRRWNGSLANAVRRYTGAKAVCQSCACSTCVSGATSGSAVSAARQKNANRRALSG